VTDLPHPGNQASAGPRIGWLTRLARSPRFHRLAARIPGLSHFARSEGRALFDIMQGFVRSQVLTALVETGVLERLADHPLDTPRLASASGLPPDRAQVLLQAAAALGLLKRKGSLWHLAPRGAAFLAVPGLSAMVRHNKVLYRDLTDPTEFFRDKTDPDLGRFWPYVFGAGAAQDPETARKYSQLMADSQGLVAADTLRMVRLGGIRHLMDVGGGTGAFLTAVGAAYPDLLLTLIDLPAVVPEAEARFRSAGLTPRTMIHPGSFRDGPLPRGADAISLVRVLYDHTDETVRTLLASCFAALPPKGRLIISEPMSGGPQPDPSTDVYFSIYTLAMGTGQTRSPDRISTLLSEAGFKAIRTRPGFRPFVTSVVEAHRP
jgi:demethylspheroidene O-methyltransferase